jgi:hypothetical protein
VDDVKQGDLARAVALVAAETGQDPLKFSSKSGVGRKELLGLLIHGSPEGDAAEEPEGV